MFSKLKKNKILIPIIILFFVNYVSAEEEDVSLKAISDQIQVIINDIKTLEKAVYQKSDIVSSRSSSSTSSDGLNEDIMTKHLLKLNEVEDQFRELTNKFEEMNFKLDKLSSRLSKVQADNQLRFQEIENFLSSDEKKENKNFKKKVKKIEALPGSSQPQDLGSIS